MKSEVRQYQDIFGKEITLSRPAPAPAARVGHCKAGAYTVSFSTIATRLGGFPSAPDTYVIFPEGTAYPTNGQIIGAFFPNGQTPVFVTAPIGTLLYEPDIVKLIGRDIITPDTRIYCLDEKSCGAVLFTRNAGEIYYLLIKNQSGHIGFPKGHMEYGETEAETIVREVFEETGLTIKPDISFREEYDYTLCGVIRKKAVFCIAEFAYESEITLGQDEIFGEWLLPYEEAMKRLGFPNDRRILTKANKRIRKIQ